MSSSTQQTTTSRNNSPTGSLSPSSSSSLVKLDELSSFGATKQNRLPALIKLNQQPLADQTNNTRVAPNSMPDFSGSQLEQTAAMSQQQQQQPQAESLPVQLGGEQTDKENLSSTTSAATTTVEKPQRTADESDDFQVVDMDDSTTMADLMGPSLPAPNKESQANKENTNTLSSETMAALQNFDAKSLSAQLQSTNLNNPTGGGGGGQQYASHLGDSLIEMVINLRNENQNLIRALETNNEYVKERLQEFKRVQEEAKRREAQFALEKAEHEHQSRKLRRQNDVLSERLKSMEAKLKEMKLEVSESLSAAHSSKASSLRGHEGELYPQLNADGTESFSNAALANGAEDEQTTMQIDATSGELYNKDDDESANEESDDDDGEDSPAAAAADEQAGSSTAQRVGAMTKEELAKRFDAQKAEFYALDDDPMKQCDQLEQQLNDIGKRDYEICLLQQQLNIYRQDFRLERMAKLEAKIQIERLKNDIDRLCLERIQQREHEQERSNRVHFNPTATTTTGSQACQLVGKIGHHLGKKAVRSAAKAAKYAAKQAHLEEKAAAALARATAAKQAAASHFGGNQQQHQQQYHQQSASSGSEAATGAASDLLHGHGSRHHRHHSHHHRRSAGGHSSRGSRAPGLGSEVVNDLLSTANKAMLTGYKMASTHVNLALDKLSQYEEQQARQLDPLNRPPIQTPRANISGGTMASPSAPPMEPPSID